ncbi:hypothetical protein Vadar_000463 [Vaccinium darrowii]|uniref:Uncharacterized protein n=1 Tax=Vaccinium darrowii TaxID=229202 RepID=A0ACB7YAK9_9ERIC|nr:hypothetical protein Vadar_000463 [Vaccinium darrowii]
MADKDRSLQEESSQSSLQLTPKEMSREVLGKRKRYILGFEVGPKSTSSSSQTDVVSWARDEEFHKIQADMEKMQMEHEEKKREHEETKRVREEEMRERDRRREETA